MKKITTSILAIILFIGFTAKAQLSIQVNFGLANDYNAQQLMAQEGMEVSTVLPLYYSGSLRYEVKRFSYAIEMGRYRSEYRSYKGSKAGGIARSAFTGISVAYNLLPVTSIAKIRGGLGVGWLHYSQSYQTIEPLASIGLESAEMERTLAKNDEGVIAITPCLELEVPIAGRLSAVSNVQMLLPLWANASVSKEYIIYNGTGAYESHGNGGGKAVADIRFSLSFGLSFQLGKL